MISALPTLNLNVAGRAESDHFPAREYQCELASAFQRAEAAAGTVVHDIRLGTALVRLRFAGPSLVPFVLPAFGHLATDAADEHPFLTVELWDGASTGVFPPPFPLRGEDAPGRGEVREYDDVGVRAVFHSGVRPHDGVFRSVTLFDETACVAQHFVTRPDQTHWHERAAPLRAVLHWALSRPDRVLVHAGAVGIGGRAVLLTGPGGSGKSTSAIAACQAGYDYLGDDYVLVDLAGPQPVAHSLYATAKLAPAAASLLPALSYALDRHTAPDGAKLVIDMGQVRPGGLGTSARIVGIVLPQRDPGGRTRLRRASAGAALQALAPSTVFQAPRRDGAAFASLAELARSVPAHVLGLGGTPDDVGPVLSRLLNGDGRP